MIVLFLYTSSLSRNSAPSKIAIKKWLALITLILPITILPEGANEAPIAVLSFFSEMPIFFLLAYLLLLLLVVTKITQSFKGALAEKFF